MRYGATGRRVVPRLEVVRQVGDFQANPNGGRDPLMNDVQFNVNAAPFFPGDFPMDLLGLHAHRPPFAGDGNNQ